MRSYNDRTSLNADQNLQYDLCSRLLRLVMTSRLQLTEAATQAPQPIQAARHGSITMVSPSLNFLFPLPCPASHTTQIFKVKFSPPPLTRHFLLGVPRWRGSGCHGIARPFYKQQQGRRASVQLRLLTVTESEPFGLPALTRRSISSWYFSKGTRLHPKSPWSVIII